MTPNRQTLAKNVLRTQDAVRNSLSNILLHAGVMLAVLLVVAGAAAAQTSPAREVVRGTVTAINNGVLTIKPDTGLTMVEVQPDPAAKIQKLEPGSTDLKSATPATAADISVGDRVLLSATAQASGPAIAKTIYVMKASDIQQKNASEEADWQKRGVGGLVRAVDPAAKTITISVVTATGTKNVTIQLTDKTELLRYAPDSIKFSSAKPAPLSVVKVGDQLSARGEKNADGSIVTADEVVTGSFRNISGLITAVNLGAKAFTIKDLATKMTVTVTITDNTDMHMLPAQMATRLAARMKGGAAAGGGQGGRQGGGEQRGGYGARSASADLTQMINAMPTMSITDLHPGEALMIAATATPVPNAVTAITVLGGVEPLLEASPNEQMTLAPWSLSGGSAPE